MLQHDAIKDTPDVIDIVQQASVSLCPNTFFFTQRDQAYSLLRYFISIIVSHKIKTTRSRCPYTVCSCQNFEIWLLWCDFVARFLSLMSTNTLNSYHIIINGFIFDLFALNLNERRRRRLRSKWKWSAVESTTAIVNVNSWNSSQSRRFARWNTFSVVYHASVQSTTSIAAGRLLHLQQWRWTYGAPMQCNQSN